MLINASFTGTIDPSKKEDIEKTLDGTPFIKKVFFTGDPHSEIVIRAICKTRKDAAELEQRIKMLSGIHSLEAWPQEEEGLTDDQKAVLFKAGILTAITFVSTAASVYGVAPSSSASVIFIPAAISGALSCLYEVYYNWKQKTI